MLPRKVYRLRDFDSEKERLSAPGLPIMA